MKGGVSGKRIAADERGLGYSECGLVKEKRINQGRSV